MAGCGCGKRSGRSAGTTGNKMSAGKVSGNAPVGRAAVAAQGVKRVVTSSKVAKTPRTAV